MYQDREALHPGNVNGEVEVCDAEILDELTTSRGEFKVRTVSSSDEKLIQVRKRNKLSSSELFMDMIIHMHVLWV